MKSVTESVGHNNNVRISSAECGFSASLCASRWDQIDNFHAPLSLMDIEDLASLRGADNCQGLAEATSDTKTLNMTSTLQDELDGFVRYSRLGLFQDAKDVYGDVLKGYGHMFPVTAEYADHLLEQGSYRDFYSFLDQKLKNRGEHEFKEDEVALLCLWKELASLHLHGKLPEVLQAAQAWRQSVAVSMSRDSLSVVDVSRISSHFDHNWLA
jgi:hypothetical protein